MRLLIVVVGLLVLGAVACEDMSDEAVAETAVSAVYETIVAGTVTAIAAATPTPEPTATPAPTATPTPTATPPPTATPLPTATPTATPPPTATPTPLPTATPTATATPTQLPDVTEATGWVRDEQAETDVNSYLVTRGYRGNYKAMSLDGILPYEDFALRLACLGKERGVELVSYIDSQYPALPTGSDAEIQFAQWDVSIGGWATNEPSLVYRMNEAYSMASFSPWANDGVSIIFDNTSQVRDIWAAIQKAALDDALVVAVNVFAGQDEGEYVLTGLFDPVGLDAVRAYLECYAPPQ